MVKFLHIADWHLGILKEYAEKMQIIVVTCDVDKYNSLTNANFISMDETI